MAKGPLDNINTASLVAPVQQLSQQDSVAQKLAPVGSHLDALTKVIPAVAKVFKDTTTTNVEGELQDVVDKFEADKQQSADITTNVLAAQESDLELSPEEEKIYKSALNTLTAQRVALDNRLGKGSGSALVKAKAAQLMAGTYSPELVSKALNRVLGTLSEKQGRGSLPLAIQARNEVDKGHQEGFYQLTGQSGEANPELFNRYKSNEVRITGLDKQGEILKAVLKGGEGLAQDVMTNNVSVFEINVAKDIQGFSKDFANLNSWTEEGLATREAEYRLQVDTRVRIKVAELRDAANAGQKVISQEQIEQFQSDLYDTHLFPLSMFDTMRKALKARKSDTAGDKTALQKASEDVKYLATIQQALLDERTPYVMKNLANMRDGKAKMAYAAFIDNAIAARRFEAGGKTTKARLKRTENDLAVKGQFISAVDASTIRAQVATGDLDDYYTRFMSDNAKIKAQYGIASDMARVSHKTIFGMMDNVALGNIRKASVNSGYMAKPDPADPQEQEQASMSEFNTRKPPTPNTVGLFKSAVHITTVVGKKRGPIVAFDSLVGSITDDGGAISLNFKEAVREDPELLQETSNALISFSSNMLIGAMAELGDEKQNRIDYDKDTNKVTFYSISKGGNVPIERAFTSSNTKGLNNVLKFIRKVGGQGEVDNMVKMLKSAQKKADTIKQARQVEDTSDVTSVPDSIGGAL